MKNLSKTASIIRFSVSVLFIILFNVNAVMACGSWIKMVISPTQPKQGDIVTVTIIVKKSSDMSSIKYKVNSTEYTIYTAPYTFTVNTCKSTGQYYSHLILSAQVTYKDGKTKNCSYDYDLTMSPQSLENDFASGGLKYVYYLSNSNDGWQECGEYGAGGFIDGFDSFSGDYFWSDPSVFQYTCGNCASNYDLVIAWGHGSPHFYYSAGTPVDISVTAYGGLSDCNTTGDPEYLVFASCNILSMDDYDSNSFWHYWFTEYGTRLEKKPFQGLHMVMGFRTLMVVNTTDYWIFGVDCDGYDFFKNFANKLDDGYAAKDAWLNANQEDLSFDDGNNRGAVIYLDLYKNDNPSQGSHVDLNDYIYDNPKYFEQYVEYYE